MVQIATKFTSDPAQLLAAYNKIYQQNVKLQQMLGQNARQSKQHHDSLMGWLKEQGHELKAMYAGYLTVGKGIEFVASANEKWRDRMKEVHEKVKDVNKDLVRQVTLAGDVANLAMLSKELGSIKGVTKAEALETYAGVGRGAPLLSPEQRVALTRSAAPAAEFGWDSGAFGEFAGELGTLNPKRSAADTTDLAAAIMQRLGKNFEKFQGSKQFGAVRKLIDSGAFSEREALSFAMQASAQDMPSLPAKIAEAINKEYEAPQLRGRTGSGVTDEERARLALSKARTPSERLAVIRSSPEIGRAALGTDYEDLSHIDAQSLAALDAAQAGSRGSMRRTKEEIERSREGRGVLAERGLSQEASAAERTAGLNDRGRELEWARDILDTTLVNQQANPLMMAWKEKMFALRSNYADSTFQQRGANGQWETVTQSGLGQALQAASPEAYEEFRAKANAYEGFEKYGENGRVNEAPGLLKEIRDEIRRGNDERRTERRTGAAPPQVNER